MPRNFRAHKVCPLYLNLTMWEVSRSGMFPRNLQTHRACRASGTHHSHPISPSALCVEVPLNHTGHRMPLGISAELPLSHGEGACLPLSIKTTSHHDPEKVRRPEPTGLPGTHMAISNCSIHFRFMSSVLQKN